MRDRASDRHHLLRWCSVCLCLVLLLPGPAAAQTFFEDVTEEAIEVAALFETQSIAFGDYDNDGWVDLFLSEYFGANRILLLHNEGKGRFVDRTVAIQADISLNAKGGGAIFGDYDNDGDLDLFVPIGAYSSDQRALNMLLRNDWGVFRDVTLEVELTDVLPSDNAIWLDYNRDGDLDLYVGNLACTDADSTVRNKLYQNRGDDRFTDVTEEMGLDMMLQSDCGEGSNGGMAAGDFNDDAWPDLYVGVYKQPNRLFLSNNGGDLRMRPPSILAILVGRVG